MSSCLLLHGHTVTTIAPGIMSASEQKYGEREEDNEHTSYNKLLIRQLLQKPPSRFPLTSDQLSNTTAPRYSILLRIFSCLFLAACWVLTALRRLSLVAVSAGFSCCGAQAVGMRASGVAACRLHCLAACGIFPNQGQNLCPLDWQADKGIFLSTAPPGQSSMSFKKST